MTNMRPASVDSIDNRQLVKQLADLKFALDEAAIVEAGVAIQPKWLVCEALKQW